MLSAILHGKKRGTGLVAVEMQEAEGAEDVLTATVFERLAYLPDALFLEILSDATGHKMDLGHLEKCDFWPSWELNNRRVEPDLVLGWTNGRVLIEAKRWDGVQQQSPEQLGRELAAGIREEKLNDRDHLIVLGGMRDTKFFQQEISSQLPSAVRKDINIHCCSWMQLFQSIKKVLKPQNELHWDRLLGDIHEAFVWHGLRAGSYKWLHDISIPHSINYSRMPSFGVVRMLSIVDSEKPTGFWEFSENRTRIYSKNVPLAVP